MKISSILSMFLYGLFAMVLVPFALVFINNYLKFPKFTTNYSQFIGVIIVLSGVVLMMYSAFLFAKHGKGGSPWPWDPPKKLVTVGVYKYIRNPMFTASGLVWFGEFVLFGSLLLLPYASICVLLNHIHLVTQDEKELEKRYGKEYLEYKKNTTRYIPKLV
jgi:protein-S-isoprenylcysteine O-methyltransferase Ste14